MPMTESKFAATAAPRLWEVGALCHAVATTLEARFNPVAVRGEISGFSRASSGHCYFALKDGSGQLRSAMFRRAASLLDFNPKDGEAVEIRGRIAVYEPRGDLQLVVESMQRAGQGALFEQFLQRKAKLESEGLFDTRRKRPIPAMPRAIGLVTSLGAAALHDVASTLQRRVPHIPVVLVPAAVQGVAAPAELAVALRTLYARSQATAPGVPIIDVILLVRGGGSIEDLWAFNDESLARAIAESPVPVITGVGHETDFTIADFCADLRAPTPTAAAELTSAPRQLWLEALDAIETQMADAVADRIDTQSQRLDIVSGRLGRPSTRIARQQLGLSHQAQRLHYAMVSTTAKFRRTQQSLQDELPTRFSRTLAHRRQHLEALASRLHLLDPALVLKRGYSWLSDAEGRTVTTVRQLAAGAMAHATLADGTIDLTVTKVAGAKTRGPARQS